MLSGVADHDERAEPGQEPEDAGAEAPAEEADPGPWSLGQVLAGRYAIERRLGGGSMGDVYLALDRLLKKHVALKSLRAELAQSRDTVRRFLREVALAHSVTHRNVVRIYDTGEEDGLPFFTMEYLQGQVLEDLLGRPEERPEDSDVDDPGDRMAVREIREVCFDVLDAMEAAHRVGVVHRDLKPGNVMLTHRGAIVMDFGVAGVDDIAAGKIPSASQIRSLVRTEVGTIFGSPAYMAPELWEGAPATVQSDLFAFGVMLYQMLTGRLPYQAKTPAAYLQKLAAGPPTRIRQYRRDAPWNLIRLVQRCMSHDPTQRPVSAAAAANLVAPLRSGRRRRAAIVGGAAALMGLGVALFRSTPTWEDYGLPDRLAEAELAAAVRAFDVGDGMASIRRLDRLAARAPDSAALAFWRATVRRELGDERGRRQACATGSPWQGDASWLAMAESACAKTWALAAPALAALDQETRRLWWGPRHDRSELLPLAISDALVPRLEATGRVDGTVQALAQEALERLDEANSTSLEWDMPIRREVAKIDLEIALGRPVPAKEKALLLAAEHPLVPIVLHRAAWLSLLTGQIDQARGLARRLDVVDPQMTIRLELEEGRLDHAWALIDQRQSDPRFEGWRSMWCGYAFRFEMTTIPERCRNLQPGLTRDLWQSDPRSEGRALDPVESAIAQAQRELEHGTCDGRRDSSAIVAHAPPPFELYLPQLEIEAALCPTNPSAADHDRARDQATALMTVAPQDPWALLMHARVEDALGRERIALNDRITVAERWRTADAYLPLVGRLRELVTEEPVDALAPRADRPVNRR
jgi:tRNA A-37 threonylcarbamoyl transferase component Bud32